MYNADMFLPGEEGNSMLPTSKNIRRKSTRRLYAYFEVVGMTDYI